MVGLEQYGTTGHNRVCTRALRPAHCGLREYLRRLCGPRRRQRVHRWRSAGS